MLCAFFSLSRLRVLNACLLTIEAAAHFIERWMASCSRLVLSTFGHQINYHVSYVVSCWMYSLSK